MRAYSFLAGPMIAPPGPSVARIQSWRIASHRIVTRACTRAECECLAFPLEQKCPRARRTYKALILSRLFIRLLFNFPFLTCPFPPRRRQLLPRPARPVVAYRVGRERG